MEAPGTLAARRAIANVADVRAVAVGHRRTAAARRRIDRCARCVDPKNPLGRANARGIVPGMGPGAREWRLVHAELKKKYRMPTVSASECVRMMRGRERATLVDVRFAPDFEQWSVPGSVSVPYVEGGFLAKLRLPGFKTVNPRFVEDVEAKIPDKTTKIILCDIWGGSLERDPPENKSFTDPTKGAGSLPAAFELYQAGYKNLYHLRGGVNQYFEDCEKDKSLPEPDPATWPGNLEWFGYRQFNQKNRAKGQRDD